MKPEINEDKITRVMNDPKRVRDVIQSGINDALLKHKQAGNPVCEWKNDKVIWIQPEDIEIDRDN